MKKDCFINMEKPVEFRDLYRLKEVLREAFTTNTSAHDQEQLLTWVEIYLEKILHEHVNKHFLQLCHISSIEDDAERTSKSRDFWQKYSDTANKEFQLLRDAVKMPYFLLDLQFQAYSILDKVGQIEGGRERALTLCRNLLLTLVPMIHHVHLIEKMQQEH